MLSAIKSLFFIIIAIVVLVILFFLGLILLIRGFLKKQLAEYAGRKLPKVLMITGAVLISLPLFAIVGTSLWGITSSVSTLYNRAHYKCVLCFSPPTKAAAKSFAEISHPNCKRKKASIKP